MLSMGEKALFIEHPQDTSNRPKRLTPTFNCLGPYIDKALIKTFTDGLHNLTALAMKASSSYATGDAYKALHNAFIDGVEVALGRIQPAVAATKAEVGEEDSGSNLDRCSTVNVEKTIAALRSESSILSGLEAEGKIAIVGGVYDVATGDVAWLD